MHLIIEIEKGTPGTTEANNLAWHPQAQQRLALTEEQQKDELSWVACRHNMLNKALKK